MFDRKRTSIYEVTPKVTKGSGVNAPKFENIFQREAYKMEHETTSGNGSLKLIRQVMYLLTTSQPLETTGNLESFTKSHQLWKDCGQLTL